MVDIKVMDMLVLSFIDFRIRSKNGSGFWGSLTEPSGGRS